VVERCVFPAGFFKPGESLHFDHGHVMEIAGKLLGKQKSLDKYPLVILVEDIEHDMFGGMIHLNLRLFIVNLNPIITMDSPERWEKIVEPRLMPIYDELMKQFAANGFSWDKNRTPGVTPPHKMTVRPKFGVWLRELKGTYKNILNDPLDAIEINDLKINTKDKTC
jgi:hypothetical protein